MGYTLLMISYVLDVVIFVIAAISVLYLFVFAVASKFYHEKKFPVTDRLNRILVLFPAYREDAVILSSVKQFLLQDYPPEKFELVVISDQMREETEEAILALPVSLLKVTFEKSSKARALNFALDQYNAGDFDVVTILDADNLVEPVYLSTINRAYNRGVKAMQAHRIAKNLQNEVAIFDAVGEEVNNTIFRKGHAALGLSAALAGSGMAFEFRWFKENVAHLKTAGEDKELEALLLSQSIPVEYLESLLVMDEKTSKGDVFYNQRQRWLSAQYTLLLPNLKKIPQCIRNGNMDYLDKILQWMMLPRIVLFGLTMLMAFLWLIFLWPVSLKWFVLLLVLVAAFVWATPWVLLKRFICTGFRVAPVMFGMMILNFFKIRKGKRFIHTPHGLE